MPGKPWTLEQEAHLIRRRAEGVSLITISAELGLPLMGVRHKASRLNAGVIPSRRGWSKVEERRLLRLFPTGTWNDIEKALPGRTRDSIRTRANIMHTRRTEARVSDALTECALIASLNESEAAYIAGLIDGEGSIIRTKKGGLNFSVGMTNEEVIRFLTDHVGGSMRAVRLLPNRKQVWTWKMSKRRACEALLARIRPYLIVKRDYPL